MPSKRARRGLRLGTPLSDRLFEGQSEMVRENEIRKAEIAVEMPPATDAGLVFIGRIHAPWTSRMETPRQGRGDGPLCRRIEVFEPWVAALDSLAQFERVDVIYWLHLSRRDLVMQSPANDLTSRGTFSLRSPAPAKSDRHVDREARLYRRRKSSWSVAWIA
jgi:hypothetical protein